MKDPLVTQFNSGSDLEAYAIYGVGIRTPQTWHYNTLCKITANDTGLTVTRPVQQYITLDFKYKWGWAVASHSDGHVRLFAYSGQSLYIAKVPWSEMEDTSKVSSWGCGRLFYLMRSPMTPLAPLLHFSDIYTQVRLLEWHNLVP